MHKRRSPQASPLFLLVQDHFRTLQTAFDEWFAPTYGEWRPVMRGVAEKFLVRGILDHGFARVRCDLSHALCPDPHNLIIYLRREGFDGTKLPPSMVILSDSLSPLARIKENMIYLPLYPELSDKTISRLENVIRPYPQS